MRAGGLLAPGRPVLVMLSGGRDSVCLLDLAVRVAGAGAVRALHVNFGLRAAADSEEAACRGLCGSLGVDLAVHRAGDRPVSGNLHAWARAERYGVAGSLAAGADVASGHTATDQVETILYRLASSPSRRALLGMPPRDGALIRPLLELTRAETAAYCRDRGLPWREDPSNEDPRFARARVRGGLVPALRAVHPAAERNVLAVAAILREEAEVLEELVDELLAGGPPVGLARLHAAPPALARLAVQRLADAAAGRPAAGVARRTGEILALGPERAAALDVGAGLRAVVEHGTLRFEPTPPRPR